MLINSTCWDSSFYSLAVTSMSPRGPPRSWTRRKPRKRWSMPCWSATMSPRRNWSRGSWRPCRSFVWTSSACSTRRSWRTRLSTTTDVSVNFIASMCWSSGSNPRTSKWVSAETSRSHILNILFDGLIYKCLKYFKSFFSPSSLKGKKKSLAFGIHFYNGASDEQHLVFDKTVMQYECNKLINLGKMV